MTDHHQRSPQTTPGDALPSPPLNKEPVELSSLEQLLQQDHAFFRTESRRLAVLAARMDVPTADIEAVVEQAWSSAFQQRHRLKGADLRPRLHGLLRKATHDKAVDLLRRRTACPCYSSSAKEREPSDEAASKHAETVELREWLEALRDQVSLGKDENLRLMHVHYFDGLSLRELAQQFGRTVKSLEGSIRRLEERMRERMET